MIPMDLNNVKASTVIFMIILFIVLSLVATGCSKTNTNNLPDPYEETAPDNELFKRDYEAYNYSKPLLYEGEMRQVNINKENPFIYNGTYEIMDRINAEETFVVFFGTSADNWSRSVVSDLITAAKKNDISVIYYVDMYVGRDIYEIQDGELVQVDPGYKSYHELVGMLKDILNDYELKDAKGKTIKVNDEKRIELPTLITVVEGKPTAMVSGISSKQTDENMDITSEMHKESQEIFGNVLKEYNDARTCKTNGGC